MKDLRTESISVMKKDSPSKPIKNGISRMGTGSYEFSISGIPYRLKTSHDEAFVQDLVDLVSKKMSEAMESTKNNSYQNAAVLTALHLAEELVLLKRRAHRELERLEEKLLVLSHDFENSKILKAGEPVRSSSHGTSAEI